MKLNVGSGQRRFSREEGWLNVDCNVREGQVPDIVALGECLPFADGSVTTVTLHHVLEHYGCAEGAGLVRECHRVLPAGGNLMVFVPDMRKIAARWLVGLIEDFTFFVNTYGAYQGSEADRHKWGFTPDSLAKELRDTCHWSEVRLFDWRPIPGADIARDWWILGMEAIK